MLRSIAIHSEPHPIVTEQAVQLLHVVDQPEIVVDVLARVVGNTPKEVDFVIDAYKDLLETDRSLLGKYLILSIQAKERYANGAL